MLDSGVVWLLPGACYHFGESRSEFQTSTGLEEIPARFIFGEGEAPAEPNRDNERTRLGGSLALPPGLFLFHFRFVVLL